MAKAIKYYINQGESLPIAVEKCYPLFTGAFSLLIMSTDTLIAVRDQYGMRPFSVAKLGNSVLFASESCSFETVGVDVHWDVGPGEMIVVTKEGMTAKQLAKPTPRFDIFEFVYFARPDSIILGQSVYQVRWDFGKALANWPGFSG